MLKFAVVYNDLAKIRNNMVKFKITPALCELE